MFGFSYGQLFLLIGATAALIGPKDLPVIARTVGRLAGRAIGYVQVARGHFNTVMQQSQAHQVHKELRETMAQLDAIRHEIRNISILHPAPSTRSREADRDVASSNNAHSAPEHFPAHGAPQASITSKDPVEHVDQRGATSGYMPKDSGSEPSDACDMHCQASAYARLIQSSTIGANVWQGKMGARNGIKSADLLDVLPISADSTGLLPKHQGGLRGSDIVLEAILEAEVAHKAKDIFLQPQDKLNLGSLSGDHGRENKG